MAPSGGEAKYLSDRPRKDNADANDDYVEKNHVSSKKLLNFMTNEDSLAYTL